MCGDCFVCIYLVCQCDGLELGRRNRRITVRGVAVRINTNICQLKKYLEKLYANVNILFNGNLPKDLHIAFEIIKLLITNGNLNLIHNNTTY